jgi:hypothetical protein
LLAIIVERGTIKMSIAAIADPFPGLTKAAARAARLLELEVQACRDRALLHMNAAHRAELEVQARTLEAAAKQLRSAARGVYADHVF